MFFPDNESQKETNLRCDVDTNLIKHLENAKNVY